MKRTLLTFTLLATALFAGAAMVSAAEEAPKPKTPATKPSTPAKPVNKVCPVEGKDHELDPKVTRLYKGKLIGFCCNDCLETFDKDPEKYVKRLE